MKQHYERPTRPTDCEEVLQLCRQNLADFLREEFSDDDDCLVIEKLEPRFKKRIFRQLLGSLWLLRHELIAWAERVGD